MINFGTEKSLGTGLEKNEYLKKSLNRSRNNLVPKKVSESISKKFGTEKSLGIGIVQILGLVTHWIMIDYDGFWDDDH